MLFPTIPGLRVLSRLGRGGMGAVYLAVDESARGVALKVIEDAGGDPYARERFEREIAAVSSIHHANIVRLIRHGEIDGRPFALFDRVRGRSLSRIGAQPWPVVVGLGRQLAAATAAVHAAGWVHRDLKRANVMVGDHGLITLIDFGLAKRWSDRDEPSGPVPLADPGLTVRGTVVGTPRYLAPETRRGIAATPATDVYALGLVLHELLGGTVDAAGCLTAPAQVLPGRFTRVLASALAPEPGRRPRVRSIATALDALPASTAIFRGHRRDDPPPTWPTDADGRPTRGAA